MKKLLTITVLLFSVTSFGQNWKNWKSTDDIRVKDLPKSKSMVFNYTDSGIVVDNFTWLAIQPKFIARETYQINIKGVLTVSAKNDTLEIKSKDIKYIKVDGKIYEIIRNTELKEVTNSFFFGRGWGSVTPYIHTDTLSSFYVNPIMKH